MSRICLFLILFCHNFCNTNSKNFFFLEKIVNIIRDLLKKFQFFLFHFLHFLEQTPKPFSTSKHPHTYFSSLLNWAKMDVERLVRKMALIRLRGGRYFKKVKSGGPCWVFDFLIAETKILLWQRFYWEKIIQNYFLMDLNWSDNNNKRHWNHWYLNNFLIQKI